MTAMSQEKMQVLADHVSELIVITPRKFKDTLRTISIERLPNPKFKLFGVKSYFNFHHSLRLFKMSEIRTIFKNFKPDLVLLEQEPYSLSTYQVMKLKKIFNFKAIIFSFQNILKKYPYPFSKAESYCLENLDFFLAGSSSVLPIWLSKGIPQEKCAVLAQVGINLNQFRKTDVVVAKNKFRIKKFAFAYAGRFVEEKGIHILIEAFSQLPFKNEAELVLIGDGPYKKTLIQSIRHHEVENQVRFFQNIKHDEMPDILNAIDVLILPSLERGHWREQFGHILIEAMACKKPVIGSDSAAIPETIGDGGLIFATGNADSLAEKMAQIYSDKELYLELSRKAFARVCFCYTNEKIVGQLYQYFCRFLE
jgi:glycosyltransferase involved in cell wall biosynthesis